MNLSAIFITILLPGVALANYDTCYHISERLFADVPHKIKLGVRIVVSLLNAKDITETMTTLIGPLAIACIVTTKQILVTISNRSMLQGIVWYKRLQIVTETGRKGVRKVAGVLISAGYIAVISGNYAVIRSAGTLPLPVYIGQWIVQAVVYIMMAILFPLGIEIYSLSNQILSRTWTNSFIVHHDKMTKGQFRVLRKRVSSLMPITYYYGSARFDEETETSFYLHTLLNTIDLLLLQ